MTAKELRERLKNVPDNAVVVLYSGYDEGDTFCTTTAAIKCKEYDAYCQGDTFTYDLPGDADLFVLAGFDYGYESVPNVTDNDLYLITNNEELRKDSLERHERLKAEQEAREKARREAEQKAFEDSRKCRYCLNFSSGMYAMHEANYDDLKELKENLHNINPKEYVVYDRVLGQVINIEETEKL